MRATRKPLLVIAVLVTSMTALVVARGSRPSTASASVSVPVVPAPDVQPSMPVAIVADDHDARLGIALHELEAGATCDARLHAVEHLIELRDPNAVSALRAARVRKDNACLRAAAAQAIKTLDGRI